MNSPTETLLIEAPAANAVTRRHRLLTACFATVTVIATLAWWTALGWAVIALAGWSFA